MPNAKARGTATSAVMEARNKVFARRGWISVQTSRDRSTPDELRPENEGEGIGVSDTRVATNLADAMRAAANVLERVVDDRTLRASVDKAEQRR